VFVSLILFVFIVCLLAVSLLVFKWSWVELSIYLKSSQTKFHPDPIWNNGALEPLHHQATSIPDEKSVWTNKGQNPLDTFPRNFLPTCYGLVVDLLRGNWCNGFRPLTDLERLLRRIQAVCRRRQSPTWSSRWHTRASTDVWRHCRCSHDPRRRLRRPPGVQELQKKYYINVL